MTYSDTFIFKGFAVNKSTVALLAGVMVGQFASPFILDAFKIPPAAGFGMDDFVSAAVIVGSVMLINMMF